MRIVAHFAERGMPMTDEVVLQAASGGSGSEEEEEEAEGVFRHWENRYIQREWTLEWNVGFIRQRVTELKQERNEHRSLIWVLMSLMGMASRTTARKIMLGKSSRVSARNVARLCEALSCGIAPAPPGRSLTDIPLITWVDGIPYGQVERLTAYVDGHIRTRIPRRIVDRDIVRASGSSQFGYRFQGSLGSQTGSASWVLLDLQSLSRAAYSFGCPVGFDLDNKRPDNDEWYLLRWKSFEGRPRKIFDIWQGVAGGA